MTTDQRTPELTAMEAAQLDIATEFIDRTDEPDAVFDERLADWEAAPSDEDGAPERMARAACEADVDVDGAPWTWADIGERARDQYRAMADAALAVVRTPVEAER